VKNKRVNLTLDEVTLARLEKLGDRYCTTRSGIVRLLAEQYSRGKEVLPEADSLEIRQRACL
jgi:hypothetical protein